MREDQAIRLQALEEKLTDHFLTEADPANWSADGVLPKNMTQEERGNRYWCKKNAVATISLTIRIGSLVGMIQRRGDTAPGDDPEAGLRDELDADVKAAEAEANKMLAKMAKRSKAKTPSE